MARRLALLPVLCRTYGLSKVDLYAMSDLEWSIWLHDLDRLGLVELPPPEEV